MGIRESLQIKVLEEQVFQLTKENKELKKNQLGINNPYEKTMKDYMNKYDKVNRENIVLKNKIARLEDDIQIFQDSYDFCHDSSNEAVEKIECIQHDIEELNLTNITYRDISNILKNLEDVINILK